MGQHVDPQPRVAEVDADPFNEFVQSPCGGRVLEAEVVRVDVEIAAVRAGLLASAAAHVAAGVLQRTQHLAIEVTTEPGLDDVVRLDIAGLRLQAVGVDVDLEVPIAADQQAPIGPRPDFAAGARLRRREPNAPGMTISGGWSVMSRVGW